MTAQIKLVIGSLATAVLVLAVALGLVLFTGDGNDGYGNMMGNGRGSMMNAGNDSYLGMMHAMGNMDSDRMLTMMRSILGQDGYQKMLDHMAQHRGGMRGAYDSDVGGMMHQMMDGMFQRMPDDSGHHMPMMGQ